MLDRERSTAVPNVLPKLRAILLCHTDLHTMSWIVDLYYCYKNMRFKVILLLSMEHNTIKFKILKNWKIYKKVSFRHRQLVCEL